MFAQLVSALPRLAPPSQPGQHPQTRPATLQRRERHEATSSPRRVVPGIYLGRTFCRSLVSRACSRDRPRPPPRAPPRWGMAVGPSPSGAASVTCGPQRSIQGPHLRMEGIQEAAWEKEREDAFVGPGSSERPELRAAARGRGWRVGGTARGRDGACPASGQGRRRPLLRAGARGAPFPGGFSKRPVSRGGGGADGVGRHTRALPLLAFAGRSGARGVSCAVEPVGTAAVAGPARARRAGRRGQEVRGTAARPRVIHKTGDRPAVPSACKAT